MSETPEKTIDTVNHCMVTMSGSRIVVMCPQRSMDYNRALNLAAWLVALADPDDDKFEPILEAVRAT